ncbi:MAG: SDR family NAD(P)-dependent oxidoreductase [Pseudomonadota bacterium]
MERALIIGSSGGIGSALVSALEARGAEVVGLSRKGNGLDVTSEESVRLLFNALEGPFDLIITATGALEINGTGPEKSLKQLDPQAMAAQFALNCIGPSLVLKHSLPLIARGRRAVLATLSARVGSISDNALGGWVSYRTAKAAVNQVIRTTAIELARSHKQAICVALHPGTVATPFTEKYLSRYPSVSPDQAANNLLTVIDGLTTDQTGQFFDWKGATVPW